MKRLLFRICVASAVGFGGLWVVSWRHAVDGWIAPKLLYVQSNAAGGVVCFNVSGANGVFIDFRTTPLSEFLVRYANDPATGKRDSKDDDDFSIACDFYWLIRHGGLDRFRFDTEWSIFGNPLGIGMRQSPKRRG